MMLFVIISVLTVLLYLYGTKNYKYWAKKGIQHDKPIPFIGTIGRVLGLQLSLTQYLVELYHRNPEEKFIGYYPGCGPAIIIKDPEHIKDVFVTDFQYFYPRGLNPHKNVVDAMLKNLFFADGDLWKLLRQRMTTAFTSGKLKAMFPLIVERCSRLKSRAQEVVERGAELDARELMARYTTDFIGAVGFGIDTDSIGNEDSTVRMLGKRIFSPSHRDIFVAALKWSAPGVFQHLKTLSQNIEEITVSLVKGVLKKRNYEPSGRGDFIDLLLELKLKGKIVGESIEKRNPDGTPAAAELELDDLLMAAQVFVFFAAGFETSSSATSFTLHQLAFHPAAQRQCQQEIDEVLARHGGKLSYDAVKELKYLEMCLRESLRLFPPLGFLIRQCTKSYTFRDTSLTIDRGVHVVIPVQALHTNEKYFPDPEQFRPERFHPDNVNEIPNHVYLPFGEGPRVCIGERLGLMQSLAGLAALLGDFSVAPSANTLRKPRVDPRGYIVQTVKDGIPLLFTRRNK